MRDSFVSAAERAVRIGFDAIEMHFAHGYLLHEFFSPVSNKRSDAYGGSLDNRMRFLRETAQVVRARCSRPISRSGARITASDWLDGGVTIDDAVALAKALKADGLDYLDASSGGLTAASAQPDCARLQRRSRRAYPRRSRYARACRRPDRRSETGERDRRARQSRYGRIGAGDARQSALGLACG